MRYPTKSIQRFQHTKPLRSTLRLLRYSLATLTASTFGVGGYLIYVDKQGKEERHRLIEKFPFARHGFDLLDRSNGAIANWWSSQRAIVTSKLDQARDRYIPRKKTIAQHLDSPSEKEENSEQGSPVIVEIVTIDSAQQAIKDALARYNDFYDYLFDALNSEESSTTLPPEFVHAFTLCNRLLASDSLNEEESSRLKASLHRLRELVDADNLVRQLKQKFEHVRKSMSEELNMLTSLTSDTGVADSMLLAHAHRKIKQLEARLACEVTLRDGKVEAEVMRRLDDRFAEIEDKLRRKVAEEEAVKMQHRIDEELRRYGALLEGRHATNLEEQRKQIESEMRRNMDRMLIEVTAQSHNDLAELEARLDALKEVLNNKMLAEERAKRSQQVWIETSRLLEAALQRTDRLAVLNSLKALRKLPGRIDLTDKIADMLANEMTEGPLNSGSELVKRFEYVRKVADHLIGIEGDLTLRKYVKARMLSMWRRITGVPKTVHLSADGFLDLNNLPPDRILAIASGFVANEDLLSAVRILQLLRGEARQAFSSWLNDTIRFLAVKQDCDVMLALATSACLSNSPEIN